MCGSPGCGPLILTPTPSSLSVIGLLGAGEKKIALGRTHALSLRFPSLFTKSGNSTVCLCHHGSWTLLGPASGSQLPAPSSQGGSRVHGIQKNTGCSVRHINARVPTLPVSSYLTLSKWHCLPVCLSFPIWEIGIIIVCHWFGGHEDWRRQSTQRPGTQWMPITC